jgi:hypothetical protein
MDKDSPNDSPYEMLAKHDQSGTKHDITAVCTTAAGIMAASVMAAGTATNVMAACMTAENTTAGGSTARSTLAAGTMSGDPGMTRETAGSTMTGSTTVDGTSVEAEAMGEVVTEETEGDSDTSLEIIERSVEALSDKEGVTNSGSEDDSEDHTDDPLHAEAHRAVEAMLEDLHQKHSETATGSTTPGEPPSPADRALDLWNDRVALHAACTKLTGMCKDKSWDIVSCARITAMVGVLNLYLETELCYTWRKASLVVAKAQGQGTMHAHNLRKWILDFIRSKCLPLHHYRKAKWTVLEDEDILQSLQGQLVERAKHRYIKAADLVEIVSSPEMQASLTQIGVYKPTITERTACNWLKKLKWRYEQKKNGMYSHKSHNA